MCGIHTGKVSLIKEVIERRIIRNHCVIHQQALCGKILKFDHVMSVVVTVVNHLCARALKHRTSGAFLKEMNAEYKDLVYHTEEVLQILKNEPQKFEKLESKSWNHNLFFLCDITSHLNDLNTQLQGKDLLIFQLVGAVKAFKMKLQLFRGQLLKDKIIHFPTCAQYIPQCQHLELGSKFAHQMEILMQESDRRLTLFQEKNLQFKLVED